MMATTAMAKVFQGANVFMSRNLVPPEHFDALHDALKLNGAQVFLCCDPSRNGANDYHVIASSDHEKFEDLRANGCNLLGPQCVLSCAKEKRALPKKGFTCCLAMDGVNVLASGFENDEKADIAKMVDAMGGTLHIKASSDVNFVIVKNVLAQKYKWALNNLKKPIVTIDWLHQCWKEHRVVPQESYRVPPFSGLTICVSGIPADERKKMEELVIKNKGKYKPELTRRCTHLVCDYLGMNVVNYARCTWNIITPEGNKYVAAKTWGHINIVTKKWFDLSVTRRACLSEESYPVQGSTSSLNSLKTMEQRSYSKGVRDSQHTSSSMATALDSETIVSALDMELGSDKPLQNMNSINCEAPSLSTDGNCLADGKKVDLDFAQHVAADSQSEDDDLYLSECRVSLVGFEAAEMRKLVNMVRRGGGSRYMSLNDRLTHIIVGTPSEIEVKEVRSLAAYGIIHVVKISWLVECNLKRKEVPVLQSHIAYDLLLPKDPVLFNKTTTTSKRNMEQKTTSQPVANNWGNKISRSAVSLDMKEEAKLKVQSAVSNEARHIRSATVFKEKLFCFSRSFPEEQRPEIVLWVNEGGGKIVADQNEKGVHFIVQRHGAAPSRLTKIVRNKYVSTHWIYSCLEDGCLLDIDSHILYSPLPCQIPLPGFEGYRLCVSRYDMKERKLLRNLCYVLGVKFVEKLTSKVTHLLCKFADGDKYEAAGRWGIHVVTAEWLYECAKQNKVVDLEGYHPKEPTSEDREGGLCSVSQYPSQSVRVSSVDGASQQSCHVQEMRIAQNAACKVTSAREMDSYPSGNIKRAKLLHSGFKKPPCSSNPAIDESAVGTERKDDNVSKNSRGAASTVPDVAAAIEDLLEQTSKIQDCKSQETISCRDDPTPDPNPSKHWMNRSEKTNDNSSVEATPCVPYDGFSETQTDSQVVGYEEDLSGRQMIIDRVRTRSSMA